MFDKRFFQRFLSYAGASSLVAIGYMDPGNWLTAIVGGNLFHWWILPVMTWLSYLRLSCSWLVRD